MNLGFQQILRQSCFKNQYVSLLNNNSYNFSNSFRQQMKKYGQKSIQQQEQRSPQEFMGTVDSIVKRRREQARYIELEKKQKEDLQIFVEAYTDTVIDFQLYYHHYNPKACELDAILNYYQIAYKRNMNTLYITHLKQAYEEELKGKEEPFLKVHVSLDPVKFYCGRDDIVKFLVDNYFIVIPKHLTHSVYAQQGVEFSEEVNKTLDIMFYHPSLTFENHFKTTPETYTQGQQQYILIRAAYRLFKKITIDSIKNIKKILDDKESYKKSREQFLDQMNNTWKGRLDGKDFHGGDKPDEADFALFGVLKAKYNSRSFKMFLERKLNSEPWRWFLRMSQLCKYEKDRTLYNE